MHSKLFGRQICSKVVLPSARPKRGGKKNVCATNMHDRMAQNDLPLFDPQPLSSWQRIYEYEYASHSTSTSRYIRSKDHICIIVRERSPPTIKEIK